MITRIHKPVTKRGPARAGFTLVEVMVGTVIFVMVAMGAMSALMQAFRVLAESRVRDRAVNVLKIASDQFQNSKIKNTDGSYKTFFVPTAGLATGTGMAWDTVLQTFVYPSDIYEEGDADGLVVPIWRASLTEDDDAAEADRRGIQATLTREVAWVNPATGAVLAPAAGTPAATTGGRLVRAVFTIRYQFLNREITLTSRALRNLNPTDK